jgi:hypothetical protein
VPSLLSQPLARVEANAVIAVTVLVVNAVSVVAAIVETVLNVAAQTKVPIKAPTRGLKRAQNAWLSAAIAMSRESLAIKTEILARKSLHASRVHRVNLQRLAKVRQHRVKEASAAVVAVVSVVRVVKKVQ